MDQRARFDDFDELVETIRDAVQAKIRKGGPMMIAEDSADGHTVKLQPLVKAVVKALDGTVSLEELPTLPDAPVHFMGGGGITTTFGLKKGDEAIGIHLDANFDAWHQQGGVQTPNDARIHNLTDTICIPGIRSDPNKLKGVSPDSTQTRTDDKQSVHDVSHTAITTIREDSAHQVNGMAIQAEKGGSQHVVDAKTIQHVASKILLNC